jgi:predicted dehydrogenase
MTRQFNRRSFVKSAATIGAAISLPALNYSRVYGANNRLGIASVGTGGKGWSDLTGVAASPDVDVVGLCDIDSSINYLGRASEKYAKARTFADWRKLLDASKDIQGVLVSTPDFMHAPIALAAMQLGKHVFCQKPLAHTVYETRQMQLAAKKFAVVTQMCNQIQSHSAYRTAVQLVHSGKIGKVKEVHSWQGASPSWPRNIARPDGSDAIPEHVRWDLWQGVAPERPYKEAVYHPFNWRGWQAYGTGQIGDFACHILDPVFKALKLGAPTSLKASAPPLVTESWTDRSTVVYTFPGTEQTQSPTIRVSWHNAVGFSPDREMLPDIPASYKLPTAGSVLIGEKGTMVIPHVAMPVLFPESKFPASSMEVVEGVDHYVQWADACRGVGATTSAFDYSGPLTEAVLLGTIGIRYPEQELVWDTKVLRITNFVQANEHLNKPYRTGWEPNWLTG